MLLLISQFSINSLDLIELKGLTKNKRSSYIQSARFFVVTEPDFTGGLGSLSSGFAYVVMSGKHELGCF